jgi:hypothetical protein
MSKPRNLGIGRYFETFISSLSRWISDLASNQFHGEFLAKNTARVVYRYWGPSPLLCSPKLQSSSLLGISSLLSFPSTKYSSKNTYNVNQLNNTNRNFYWKIFLLHSSLFVVSSTLNPYFSILYLIPSAFPRIFLYFSCLLFPTP